MKASKLFSAAVLVCSLDSLVLAQTQSLVAKPEMAASPTAAGWAHRADATLGANFVENTNVVGQADGRSSTYSLKLSGESKLTDDGDEWRNTALLSQSLTRTPVIDKNVKSADELKLESLYMTFLANPSWVGVFARVGADTSLFDTYDYQAASTTYAVARRSGAVDTVNADSLHLADGFEPLTTKESFGLVLRPLNDPRATLEVRAGLGAIQTKAKGVLLVKDDQATAGVIEVTELDSVEAVGLETAAGLKGDVLDKRVSYGASIETLTPYSYTPKPAHDDRTPSQLTRTESRVGVALNMTEWSALSYGLKSKRDPLLVDKAEVTQEVLATLSYKLSSAP